MDFNKIEAEERHIFKLWTLCRVCGQTGDKLQYCLDNYADLLDELYNIIINDDDPAVHPQMVCQKCRLVLQHYLKKVPKSKTKSRLPDLPTLYVFKRHSEECDVCDRASGWNAKRKQSLGSGDMEAPAKLARKESEEMNIQATGDAGTGNGALTEKGNGNELDVSQENQRDNVLLQAIQGTMADDVILPNVDEDTDKPEQEGFTKYVYLNMIRRFKARGIKDDQACESVDISRFKQQNFASTFLICALCKRLPLKPVTTECKHIFCEACISDWLNFGNVCPKCEEVIVELTDATEQLSHLYALLDASCSFENKGCDAKLTPFEISVHEKACPFNNKSSDSEDTDEEEEEVEQAEVVQRVSTRKRKSLRFVTTRLATTRMEELTKYVDTTCKRDREDTIDVLFYMLKEALSDANDSRTKEIDLLWKNKKPILISRPRRMSHPQPSTRLIGRRKGIPTKRGRPRKIVVPVQDVSSESDEENSAVGKQRDLELKQDKDDNKTDQNEGSNEGSDEEGTGDTETVQPDANIDAVADDGSQQTDNASVIECHDVV